MKTIELVEIKTGPAETFERLFKDRPFPFLLESGMYHSDFGRYSIMGAEPFIRFKSKGKKVEIWEDGKTRRLTGNPFNALQKLLKTVNSKQYTADSLDNKNKRRNNWQQTNRQLLFAGGAVGYFSYDMGWHIEDLPNIAKDDLNLPDCCICFYNKGVVYDHQRSKNYYFSDDPEKESQSLNKAFLSKKGGALSQKSNTIEFKCGDLKSNFSFSSYKKAVDHAKSHIKKGDIYQVNLSQRFVCQTDTQPFELYKRLRVINPAPFSSYLDYGDFSVVSSSPERFLRIQNGIVQTRPIKGTRPRGKTPAEDVKFSKELLDSKKDRAELVMIVDLERNDLGRVCEYGSVKVKELATLEKYPTVFHTVATAEGRLYKGKDAIDLLKASFPGGSITGAPKIRSMEIIEELEPVKRGIYTGAIGYIGFDGNMDTSIAIRTFIIKDKKAYFQVGGGIVADSEPGSEYRETLDKAQALIKAVQNK